MTRKVLQSLAGVIGAYHRCVKSGNDWADKHEERLRKLIDDHFPSGSGFDNGTELDLDASSEEKIVFHTSFHHMSEGGMYDGWTEHTVTVRPSLAYGYRLSVSGRDRNQVKEYIAESFSYALDALDEHDANATAQRQAEVLANV